MLAREANGSDTLLRRYVYGQRLIFMSTTSSNAWYYHYDPLGSVRNVTSSTGATQLTYDYEPYGAIRSSSGSTPTNLLEFTGEYNDPTGLYHLRARQYDPGSARFLSADPAERSGLLSAIGTYVFGDNQPMLLIDPSGEGAVFASRAGVVAALRPTILILPPADAVCAVGNVRQRENCGFTFFAAKGLTSAQSAGVTGNLWHESGKDLNPRQWEFRCKPSEYSWNDGNCGVGIAQWTTQHRKEHFLGFAGSVRRAYDYFVQLAFVWEELVSGDGPARGTDALRNLRRVRGANVRAVDAATERFMWDFESPAASTADLGGRQQRARSIFRRHA